MSACPHLYKVSPVYLVFSGQMTECKECVFTKLSVCFKFKILWIFIYILSSTFKIVTILKLLDK